MKLITIPNKNFKKFNDFFLYSSRKQFKFNFFGRHPIFFQTKLTTHTCTHKYISYITFKINFQITLYMALIRPPSCYIYIYIYETTHTYTQAHESYNPFNNAPNRPKTETKKSITYAHNKSKVIYTFPKSFFFPIQLSSL